MEKRLRTRCPICRTVFALSSAQLEAGKGLARCGRCREIFRADVHLLDPLPDTDDKARTRADRASEGLRKRSYEEELPDWNEIETTEPQLADDTGEHVPGADFPGEFVTADVAELLTAKWRVRASAFAWLAGVLALSVILLGQVMYFYATELARYPRLRPLLTPACELLGCEIRPLRNVDLIELVRTTVAPHPEYPRALRIRAALVNRANFTQPYPLMEVTLTDNAGAVVARRAFSPREYLKVPNPGSNMTPNVVIDGLLDISDPDPNPGGYEIRLIAR